ISIYHKIKFSNSDNSEIVDSIQIRPEQKDGCGCLVPLRFDTVLVRGKDPDAGIHGINGHQIAQVRVVFKIPSKAMHNIFPSSDVTPPDHLAYVEWVLPIPVHPGPNHLLYKVNRLVHHGRQHASIIPVKSILRSVHLFPVLGQHTPPEWNMFTVLESCNAFYINPFSDRDNYMVFS
ncbi:hypothetical protein V8E53_014102, partial [Lactarius tabidus]